MDLDLDFVNELPLVGGLYGSVFGDDKEDALAAEQRAAGQRALRASTEIARGAPGRVQSALYGLQPANQMLGHMYGPEAMVDFDQISRAAEIPVDAIMADLAQYDVAPQQSGSSEGMQDLVTAGAVAGPVGLLYEGAKSVPILGDAVDAVEDFFGGIF